MTLDGLETKLQKLFGKGYSNAARANKVHLCRYADDFIITGSSKELLEKQVKPMVQEFLKERGLSLSEEKTLITHISRGFDFLGQNIRKYKGKLLIKPSKKSVKNFHGKVKDTMKAFWSKPHLMIKKLNSSIKGWCNYHKHVNSKKTFNQLDYYIYQRLWKWSRRTHRNKGKRWIAGKYFHRHGKRKWVFTAKDPKKKKVERLNFANLVKIQSYIKIKGDANPYDEEWKAYFETRKQRIIAHHHPGIHKMFWERQRKICAHCHKEIETFKDGRVHFPHDNVATDDVPIHLACMVHKGCHEEASGKSGSTKIL